MIGAISGKHRLVKFGYKYSLHYGIHTFGAYLSRETVDVIQVLQSPGLLCPLGLAGKTSGFPLLISGANAPLEPVSLVRKNELAHH